MTVLQKYIKPIIDITISAVALLILAPLLLIIAFLILIWDGAPVLFYQDRPGYHEKIFRLYKFRTMAIPRDEDHNGDFARITNLGSILRKTSLDELPQLFNVLCGDISLVGPRPLLTEYLPLYSKRQKMRHLVKPGITGWAQVNGRNLLTWEQKFDYDVWYVENWTLWLDFKILLLTFRKLIRPTDTNASLNVTMQKFKGSDSDVSSI